MKQVPEILLFLFCLLIIKHDAVSQSKRLKVVFVKDTATNMRNYAEFENIRFERIDSFARTVKYENGLIPLTNTLTQNYTSRIEKLRAIFIWITENIKYDCAFLNGDRETPEYECEGDSLACVYGLERWEMKYINHVLQKKKAICQGYSMLLKKMCDISGIECEILSGFAKTEPYQVGNPFGADHAWNAVRIDGKYYFLDATWAAGFCPKCFPNDDLYCKFVKDYSDYYWLTPFDKLMRNHYPSNGRLVIENNYTKEKFFNNAFYYSIYALEHLDILAPNTGVIEAKAGDTIHFRFKYTGPTIEKIQANTNVWRNPDIYLLKTAANSKRKLEFIHDTIAEKKQVYLPFKKDGDIYSVDYKIDNSSLYYIDMTFDRQNAMRFKVRIK